MKPWGSSMSLQGMSITALILVLAAAVSCITLNAILLQGYHKIDVQLLFHWQMIRHSFFEENEQEVSWCPTHHHPGIDVSSDLFNFCHTSFKVMKKCLCETERHTCIFFVNHVIQLDIRSVIHEIWLFMYMYVYIYIVCVSERWDGKGEELRGGWGGALAEIVGCHFESEVLCTCGLQHFTTMCRALSLSVLLQTFFVCSFSVLATSM